MGSLFFFLEMEKNLFYPAFQMKTLRPLRATCLKSAKCHNSISAEDGADQKRLEGRRGAHLSTRGQFLCPVWGCSDEQKQTGPPSRSLNSTLGAM